MHQKQIGSPRARASNESALKKFGAIQIKTSTYVLPDEPIHYERFQSLAKQIVDNGGESALVRVKEIEGMPYAALVAMFNEARAREYEEIAEPLTLLIRDTRTPYGASAKWPLYPGFLLLPSTFERH